MSEDRYHDVVLSELKPILELKDTPPEQARELLRSRFSSEVIEALKAYMLWRIESADDGRYVQQFEFRDDLDELGEALQQLVREGEKRWLEWTDEKRSRSDAGINDLFCRLMRTPLRLEPEQLLAIVLERSRALPLRQAARDALTRKADGSHSGLFDTRVLDQLKAVVVARTESEEERSLALDVLVRATQLFREHLHYLTELREELPRDEQFLRGHLLLRMRGLDVPDSTER